MSSEPEGPSGPANPTPGVSEEMPEVPRAVDLGEMLAPAVMPVIEFRPYDIVTFFKSLPDEIKDILIRESYLARAAEILTAKQVENKQDHAKVQARRPMLMAVRPQARIAYESELAEAEKEVQFFARALTQNDAAMDNLRKAARRHLEVWLRNHDTTYMSGLASEQLLSDWRNAMELVSSIMLDFVKSLGEARNLMVSGYDKENNIYSPKRWMPSTGR